MIANNECSSLAEFQAKYFLHRNARYAALTGGHRKDFGWHVLLKTIRPEWLKEGQHQGLTEIIPIPERMELDYLFRMRPKLHYGSAEKGLCALNCACCASFSCYQNIVLSFGLTFFSMLQLRGRRQARQSRRCSGDSDFWVPSTRPLQ
jgi:hypothetical protein